MQPVHLSKADSRILAQVFDPESGASKAEVIIDPSLSADRHIQDETLLASLRAREKDAIRLIEQYEKSSPPVKGSKSTVYQQSLAVLDEILREYPEYASALNNRAQLRRWYWGDRNMLCQRRGNANEDRRRAASQTVRDLKETIATASPERPTDAVSPAQGRLLGQAYTQLGALYHAAAKDMAEVDGGEASDLEVHDGGINSMTQIGFEEEASRCFFLGGMYGNEVAKALAVHTNPQAKLCGEIVKEAMRKELGSVS